MDRDREIEETFSIHAEKFPYNHEVTAGTDGQELGKALDQAEKESLQPVHLTSCYLPFPPDAS